jgi:hypothetical protein
MKFMIHPAGAEGFEQIAAHLCRELAGMDGDARNGRHAGLLP